MRPFLLCVSTLLLPLVRAEVASLNQTGCGGTKGCLFKPTGCDPAVDCTVGVVFTVTSDNWLDVEMTAQALQPHVDMQYIAIGFSRDAHMGDDAVTECVISNNPALGADPQVYLSYNNPQKSNTRLDLSDEERKVLIKNVDGSSVNGRLNCRYSQQIVSTVGKQNIWPLNEDYFILAATGAAQPNGVIAHDTNAQSQFFPALSAAAINPAKVATGAGAARTGAGAGPPAIGPQTGPAFGPQTVPQSPQQGSGASGPPQAQPEPVPEHEPGHDHDEHGHEHEHNAVATTPLNSSSVSLASAVLLLVCLLVAQ